MSELLQVASLLQQGIAAARAGRRQEARRMLLRVLEADERNEVAWLWLSGVVDSPADQRVCLENVLTINPGNAHAQKGLQVLDRRAAANASTQERCPHCHEPVPQAGRTCPHCGQALVVVCPGCGDYVEVEETACPHCGQPLGDFRDRAQYYLGLAEAYAHQRRNELIAEATARAQEAAEDDPQVPARAGALYEEIGDTEAAIVAYRQGLKRHPDSSLLHARLATIYDRRAMPGEARAMYERAVELGSDDPAFLCRAARFYLKEQGDALSALNALVRAVQLAPDHAECHALLGDVYRAQGKRAQALQHYEKACRLTAAESPLGQRVRHQFSRLQPAAAEREAAPAGWAETVRHVSGLMLSPALAALANGGLRPQGISLGAWVMLLVASVGSYLWASGADVPRNPLMQTLFGKEGMQDGERMVVRATGALLWTASLITILGKV